MSYLEIPRLCITGTFEAVGVTANNILAARKDVNTPNFDVTINNWHWNNYASNQFSLVGDNSSVVSAWDDCGQVTSDPVIGAVVLGDGMMADLDPEHRRVTDLFGFQLSIRQRARQGVVPATQVKPFATAKPSRKPDPQEEALLTGSLNTTQLRDYWEWPVRGRDPTAYLVSTVWQSVLVDLKWSPDFGQSKVLRELHRLSRATLSVRFALTRYVGPGGMFLAVIGPHRPGEPEQIAPGRRAITPVGTAPWEHFPAASFLVDKPRRKLIVDFGCLIPLSASATDRLVAGLTAKVGSATIGAPRDLRISDWLLSAGLVEWDLNKVQQGELANTPLHLEFTQDPDGTPTPSVLDEHAEGKYVDVDRRSLRVNPGGRVIIPVYARQFGNALPFAEFCFYLKQQAAIDPVLSLHLLKTNPYYPTNPDAKINSLPDDIFETAPPLKVRTDANGRAELDFKIKSGPFKFPSERCYINSQLYFLGDPDGWQLWGALGPEVGAKCALTLLVFNTDSIPTHPKWDDVKGILALYARLYPIMGQIVDLADEAAVALNAYRIRQRLDAGVDEVDHMPVTRELAEFERTLLKRYLDSIIATHRGGP